MAKFGHVFISGIVWIAIAVGVGLFGTWLSSQNDSWSTFGWVIALIGYGFAILAAMHLWRMTSCQMRGMQMMSEDPERFAELKRQYDDAIRRVDEQGK